VVLLPPPVKNAMLGNFKMYPGLPRATIAQLVITKATRASRIASGVFLGSTKIEKVKLLVKTALKTRPQTIANATLRVTCVVQAGQHQMEV
jgi:hypothetical protein